MSLQRSPQVMRAGGSSPSEEKISLRNKYKVIVTALKKWVKNVPHPIEEGYSEILANLEAQLERYGDISSALQSTVKYMQLIEEITDPNGAIYKQIVLMVSKPHAKDLLEYLNAEYDFISMRLNAAYGNRDSGNTSYIPSPLHVEAESLTLKADIEALTGKLEEEFVRRLEAEALVIKLQEELAAKKAEEEALATKLREEALARKLQEELATRKAEEEALAKKLEEELGARKAEEEALAKKLEEELAARKAAEELAAKKAEEQALAKKSQEEALARKLQEEALAKKLEEELATRKAAEELATRKAESEALAKKLEKELETKKAEEEALHVGEESVPRKEEEAPIKRVLHKAEVKTRKAGEGTAAAKPAEEVMENVESLRHAIEKDFKSFDPSHSATNAKFIARPVQGEKAMSFPIFTKTGGHYTWKEMTIGAYREEALSRSKNTKVSPNEVEMSVAHAVGFQEYLRIKNFFQDDYAQIVSAIRAIPSKGDNTKAAKIALETAYIEAAMSHMNIDGINITYTSKNGIKSSVVTKNLKDFLRSNVEEACKFLAHDIFHDSSVVLAHLEHSIDAMGSVMAGMGEIDMSNITFNSHL